MISAQQRLDLQSEAYISGSSSARPLPSLFRLPRLKATIKCAIEKKTGKNVDLLFYSTAQSATALQQHTIDFELVAIPPPQELRLPGGNYFPLMPRLELIFERARRRDLVQALLASTEASNALGLTAGIEPDSLSDLIIWQFVLPAQPDSQSATSLFVLAARNSGIPPSPMMCSCLLDNDPASQIPRVKFCQPLPWTQLETKERLKAFLLAAGLRQADLLKS
jgi:hypothetical protein